MYFIIHLDKHDFVDLEIEKMNLCKKNFIKKYVVTKTNSFFILMIRDRNINYVNFYYVCELGREISYV